MSGSAGCCGALSCSLLKKPHIYSPFASGSVSIKCDNTDLLAVSHQLSSISAAAQLEEVEIVPSVEFRNICRAVHKLQIHFAILAKPR